MDILSLSPGDLPNPGIEPRFPALQADSLPVELQGKPKNTAVGILSLFQGIFPTQGSNPRFPQCRWILYQLNHQGSSREGIKTQPFNCKLIQPLWKIVWRFLKKLGITVPYHPTIPLLDIHPEKTIIEKDTCTPVFTAALFTRARTWKQPRCPSTDEWIKKLWYIYTMEYYSPIKKHI